MKTLKLFCMALVAMMAMASCHKEGGNANVTSTTVTVYSNEWTWDEYNGNWYVTVDNVVGNGTFNYGAALVYMDTDRNTWSQLPLTYYYTDVNDAQETINCQATIEVLSSNDRSITLRWTEADFFDGKKPLTHTFKIVGIEPY